MKLRFSIIVSVLAALLTSNVALAQQFTLLPAADKDADCDLILNLFELGGTIPKSSTVFATQASQADSDYDAAFAAAKASLGAFAADHCAKNPAQDPTCDKLNAATKKKAAIDSSGDRILHIADLDKSNKDERNNLLGCAIKTGRISLQMIPYFISYISNFLLSIVGLICVLFIVLGGYQYVAGGLTENKERGKKYIYHALLGMAVAILSWIIVNVVMYAVTS